MKSDKLYGLVLSGGQSKRMHADKSLFSYYGVSQIEHCFQLLSKLCDKVYISSRKSQADKMKYKRLPQIYDFIEGLGPIGGIVTALKTHPRAAWLVLACDLPFITEQTLSYLIKNRNKSKIATAYRSSQDAHLPEPLCAIYEPKSLSVISEFSDQKVFCPRKILLQSDIQLIAPQKKNALDNINTREEYEKALKFLKNAHTQ